MSDSNSELYECPNPLHFYELGKRFAFGFQIAKEYWADSSSEDTVNHIYFSIKRVHSKTYLERVQFNITLGRLALTLAYMKRKHHGNV